MFVKVYLIFLDSYAVLAFLSQCCDQIPDQKQLKGASVHFGSKFERIHSVVMGGMAAGGLWGRSLIFTGQDAEIRWEGGRAIKPQEVSFLF